VNHSLQKVNKKDKIPHRIKDNKTIKLAQVMSQDLQGSEQQ
jgi:hypothetical protein